MTRSCKVKCVGRGGGGGRSVIWVERSPPENGIVNEPLEGVTHKSSRRRQYHSISMSGNDIV